MNKQQILEQIDELKQKIEELEKEVDSFEFEEIKKGVRWKPEYYQNYFYIDDCGKLESESYMDEDADLFRFNTGNCFKTEQEAEEYKENLLTKQALKDLALELNNGVEINWENQEQWKFYIYFNYSENQLCTYFHSLGQNLLMTYCLNKDFLDIAKERIGEEKLIKLIKSGV